VSAITAYRRRIVDDELDELTTGLAAIAIEGPKGVGKTRTALERARTVRRLDDPAELAVARADPARLLDGGSPVLIDEWQRLPQVWDLVRRAVDDGAPAGSFLLAGSAVPDPPQTHPNRDDPPST
jgi:predicted AAA+ superfamily ATPase